MESMTGFGRGSARKDGREIDVELKAVNHRYLDIAFRLPKNLSFLEDAFRALLKQNGVERGHIDVSVAYRNTREDAQAFTVDEALLRGFNRALHKADKLLKVYRRPTVAEALALSGALQTQQAEEDAQALQALAMEAAGQALAALKGMRQAEGQMLAEDLLQKLDALSALRDEIALRAPQVPEEYRKRLTAKLAEWQVEQADPQRVAQEVALMADRCAIDEELSRLQSHIVQFRDTVQNGCDVGKKLDFLLQEMNREANTIGSKASDAVVAQKVVAAKCVIEKLREQVQNAA